MKNFRTFLILSILMTVGCAVLPFIDVADQPRERQGRKLTVSYSWPGASAKVVEQNVTSRLEGLVSAVKGVESTESESSFGGGRIVVELKKGTPVSAAKFEIMSLLRQTYRSLPDGVGYPDLQGGEVATGQRSRQTETRLLSYRVFADMSGRQLREHVLNVMENALGHDPDVKRIEVTGARDKFIEITYDPEKLAIHGLHAADIENGIKAFMGREDIAGSVTDAGARTVVRLATDAFATPLEEMPLKNMDGKTVFLNDLAKFDYRDKLPDSYFRVNGQNTVFLNIYIPAESDRISVSRRLRKTVGDASADLSEGVSITLDHDEAAVAESHLSRLVRQTAIALLILLLFVWIVSRSRRYVAVISIALLANILLAAILYRMLDIRLHVYSLAGITVSLGMIVDATVVMADHYGYYRNRHAFFAIFAALLTTIGSLVVVLWLPEPLRTDMYDFAIIIMVNLTVALIVAYVFTPALIEGLRYKAGHGKTFSRPRRISARWKKFYTRYVSVTQNRKWIPFVLVLLVFGIPFHLLPSKWGGSDWNFALPQQEKEWYAKAYDSTFGTSAFQTSWKPWLSKIFGGTWRLFSESTAAGAQRPDIWQPKHLQIRGRMPVGGSAHELNEKVMQVEAFLSQFEKIKRFETNVASWGAVIDVTFSDSIGRSAFPYELENRVIGKLISIGGAEWSTRGVSERGFSNSLNLQYRANRISLSGYNYDRLYRMAENLTAYMAGNPRVVDVTIETPGHEQQEDEFFMVYDRDRMSLYGFDLPSAHSALSSTLGGRWIGEFNDGHIRADMYMKPSGSDSFDLWHLGNAQLRTADSTQVTFSNFMEINRREAKNVIPKKNQEYVLNVAFNILGSYSYASKYIKNLIDRCNASMPVGFRCDNTSYGWYRDTGEQYWLLLLIVVIIFFVCAVLYESLSIPLAILSLVPVSFVGAFLTYSITGVPFGTGGFAALVLLAGLTVNAGIYIISQYRENLRTMAYTGPCRRVAAYVRGYNHKIVAVFLTILTTVLTLIPFFIEREDSDFWFSFAAGTAGGLLCSVIALVFLMPVTLRLR